MSSTQTTTIRGRLGKDPELRYTPSGKAVVNLTLANTKRRLVDGQWQDGSTLWITVTAWDELASNAAASLQKGQEVIVMGELNLRSWEKEGVKQSVIELAADSIAPTLNSQTAVVTKKARENSGGYSNNNNSNNSSNNSNNNSSSAGSDEPPF